MILRRLVAQLREQNWTAIAVEFVLLVIGVFLGLQASNWNDARNERAQGERWRQQILADLDQNARDLQDRLDYNSQALAFGETALRGLESAEAPTGAAVWETVLGAFQAGQIWPYRLTGPSYREVQAAGGLTLIGSERAQVKLAYLYDVSAHDFELVSGGLPKYRELIRERMPWSIQSHIWDSNCQTGSGRPGLDEPGVAFELVACPAPGDQALLQTALNQLRVDTEIQRALRGRLSQLKASVASTARQIERVRSVRESLE
ncbi:MAG: hypothetical protein KDI71_06205 [Xanthomonadales bacterium]|nr:hypothetical protein [Xanthomonadales bacterium]